MRVFTNKGVIQKTIIATLIVILTTFCVPGTVQADVGGKLMSPIVNFVAAIFDGIQHLLESTMLGETSNFMKTIGTNGYQTSAPSGVVVETDEFIDATFFGLNAVNIPVITYTPEAIFSNQVPALDINFITPSIKTGNDETDQKMNIAMKLRPTIASWYVALRSIAVIGLLSVLVYLGIRMLLTSIAADRAKYKQMLMDWVVAMCLVFVLHYIMSFALTMVETVTAMIASDTDGSFTVHATNVDGIFWTSKVVDFSSNLMSYVRFMIQAGDLNVKIGFLALYIMLVIFSIRFTWVYLKRVVNMAFLTLIAPMVALTYPLDKVSDGKAQAFNMWLKEYTYNALIQPIHLLLYKVLLGTAVELAVYNPLYAIVSLGFIIAAEKLVKQMFGFSKASGGTVGSLAGAAGVTAVASKALQGFAKKGPGPQGKVRTKEGLERQGKDADANKPFNAFKGKDANDVMGGGLPSPDEKNAGGGLPSPDGENAGGGLPSPDGENISGDLPLPDGENAGEGFPSPEDNIPLDEGPTFPMGEDEDAQPLGLWDTMKQDTSNFFQRNREKWDNTKGKIGILKTEEGKKALGNKIKTGINKRAIGAWKALPTVGYSAARGTLKTASRIALGAALGGVGLAIGATTGDGEKAVSMALGAAAIGGATGGNMFETTVGKSMPNRSISDAYGAGKYGNAIDAKNAKADKEYLKSEKFNQFYEKYYKNQKDKFGNPYSKKQIQEAALSYRQAGITKESEIRRAMKLEEEYRKRDKLSQEDARKQVQNIVQSYGDMDIDKKAYSDPKMRQAEITRIAGMLGDPKLANNQQMAKQIFQGYVDWRNSAV